MHALIKPLWRERGMTIVMVTHDISEAFALGTRLIAFDQCAATRRRRALTARRSPTISI